MFSNHRNAITLLVGCFFAACSNAPGSVSLAGKGGTGVALSAAAGGFVISSPLTFDKTNIVLGDTLNGSVTYTNTSSGSIALQHVVIVAGLCWLIVARLLWAHVIAPRLQSRIR